MEQRKRAFTEPGRRYTAGRVPPRAGSDVYRPERRPEAATKAVPASGKSDARSTPKRIDGVAKPATAKSSRTVSKTKPAQPRTHRSLVLKRHIVERANQHRKDVRLEHKRHFASFLVGLIIVSALGVIGWAFWDFLPGLKSISIPFLSSHQAQGSEVVVPKQKSNLDESQPSAGELKAYQAAADAPRLLRIPKLDIEARIKRVGSSLNGEPISPTNIFDVGWYDNSGKPGQPGAVLMNGHVSGATKDGIFHDLDTLNQGDEIQIERGDYSLVTYVVDKVKIYNGDQIDMSTAMQSVNPNKNGLNLMTSSANYDGGFRRSDQRVMVFAVQK